MKTHTSRMAVLATAVSLAAMLGSGPARADAFDNLFRVSQASTEASQASQAKVDKIADETRDLLQEYKTVTKQVDGLKVYNERLQRQIENQAARIKVIEQNIDNSTIIARQITPLVIRMIDGLEKFVELDVPFQEKERVQRIKFLRDNLDRADVSVAEKFRAVLEAYNIELQYGRGIDTYRGSIDLDGNEREVDFLRVGRVALVYQTTDGAVSGAWDNAARTWVELPSGDYDDAIRKGIRIAKKQATIELMNMPVAAPEANQ